MLNAIGSFFRERRERDRVYRSIVDAKRTKVCLVIMDFDERFLPRFEAIKRTIEPEGFEVRRSERFSSATIAEKVVQDILAADVVVADLTDDNLNVLYELGIADSTMRPVVLIRNAVSPDAIPIDLRARQVVPTPAASEATDSWKSLAEAVRSIQRERPQNPVASVLTTVNIKVGRPLFWSRLLAGYVDILICGTPFYSLGIGGSSFMMWGFLVVICCYHAVTLRLWNASIGKLLFNLRVRSWDGGSPTLAQILIRSVLWFPIGIGMFGFFTTLIPPGHMAIYDYVTKTQVVKRSRR